MKKFLVLYMADSAAFEAMMRNATPEQQRKGMEAWMKWMGDHKAALVTAARRSGKPSGSTSKGASDTKNGLGGYSVVRGTWPTQPRSYSVRTTRTCKCPAPGSKSSRS